MAWRAISRLQRVGIGWRRSRAINRHRTISVCCRPTASAWRVIWCFGVVIGASQPLQLVWRLGDISNAFMALPNLLALALLSGVVFKIARGEKPAALV